MNKRKEDEDKRREEKGQQTAAVRSLCIMYVTVNKKKYIRERKRDADRVKEWGGGGGSLMAG